MTRHVFKNQDSIKLLKEISNDLEVLRLNNRIHFALGELVELELAHQRLENVLKSAESRPEHIEEYC